MIKEEIKKLIENSIETLQKQRKLPKFDVFSKILVEQPKEERHGDYATNIAIIIAKHCRENPLKIANLLSDKLKKAKKLFSRVETASPGFINFFLSQKILLFELKEILRKKDKYGQSKIGKGKTIIIDYSSVNIAKPFSVGHLRSTLIGQAIYNLYKFLGYKTIGDNHLGDWGTQFGKLICAVKKWGNEKEIAKNPIKNLVALYIKFHQEAEKNPALEEEGRRWFKKLEEGDKEAKRLWKKCVKWSLKEFNNLYKILEIKIDMSLGESFYRPMLESVIKESLKKKVAVKSQGAVIIPFPKEILPPLMIRKSDGATLYSTRDLAAIKYRRKKYKPYKIIYEVGAEQTLYFKQLFWAAELLGWGKREDYVHIAHGMMRLPTGRMRTRKGETILLEDLLKEAFEKAIKIVEEKNPGIKTRNKEEVAKIIGIGAIKYNNLSRKPLTDIIFKWDEALNLEGNSGPYLQYSYVRAKSIIKKSKIKTIKFNKKWSFKEEKEVRLLKRLIRFPEVVEQAAKSYSPNLVCNYIFELAQDFNSFYESVPVLKEQDKNCRMARLALVESTAQVIKNGLNILGIKTLEEM